uniref:Uncharacterized protein n=1 Tax=Nelumbo nucifera TaxID=4432 RepID=A0A822Z3F7_NELNU|nr:TPA_asm: hypothetical protein HUJ06_013650 [Nelumbo nucifera]
MAKQLIRTLPTPAAWNIRWPSTRNSVALFTPTSSPLLFCLPTQTPGMFGQAATVSNEDSSHRKFSPTWHTSPPHSHGPVSKVSAAHAIAFGQCPSTRFLLRDVNGDH